MGFLFEDEDDLLGDLLALPSRSTSGLSTTDDTLAPMQAGRSISGLPMVEGEFLDGLAATDWLSQVDVNSSRACSSNKDSQILDNLCDVFKHEEPHIATLSPPSPLGVGGNARPLSPLPFCSRQTSSTSSVGSLGSMPFPDDYNDDQSWDIDTDETFTMLTETASATLQFQSNLLPPALNVDVVKLPVPSIDLQIHLPRRQHCGFDVCGVTPTGRVVIPRPSREILVEGMEPTDMKKQKIARYLEKRKRRLSRRAVEKKPPAYQARSNVAGKRVRIGGRFVSSSEWGKRERIAR